MFTRYASLDEALFTHFLRLGGRGQDRFRAIVEGQIATITPNSAALMPSNILWGVLDATIGENDLTIPTATPEQQAILDELSWSSSSA
jgi:hypothetical protein